MTRLIWGDEQALIFEQGVSHGVYYPKVGPGLAWNGLVAVSSSEEGTEVLPLYLDGEKVANYQSLGTHSGSIEAFTIPPIFFDKPEDEPFGFSYRVKLGKSYLIHLVYNAEVSPPERTFQTLSEKPLLSNFVWDFTTKPESVPGFKPSSHFVIFVADLFDENSTSIHDILYGTNESDPRLPTINELIAAHTVLLIVDHGDGTFTASGPDEVVSAINETTYSIAWSSVIPLDAVSYRLTTY